jgi:uncharacterized protein YbdZ (MbtH family)
MAKNHNTLKRLLEQFGNNQSAVATALNTTRQCVSLWVEKGYIPARWSSKVERASGRQISALEVMETAIHCTDQINKTKEKVV